MIQKEARVYVNSDLGDFFSFSTSLSPTVEKEQHRIKAKR